MGTYQLSSEEIADIFEDLDFESHCEGDFYEEDFILGAMRYLNNLRGKGAYIYSEKKKIIKEFKEKLEK
jgi:hypothetical protein